MGFLRHSGISLFAFSAISFAHKVGSACAVTNIPNPFSWLLWLLILFFLILLALLFVRWVMITRLSHNIAIGLRLFK